MSNKTMRPKHQKLSVNTDQCGGPEAGYPEDVLAEVLVAAVLVEVGREIGAC